jgi:hypothetical protein
VNSNSPSRFFVVFMLEIALFLSLMHLASSPLGAGIPSGPATAAFVIAALAIVIFLVGRRFARIAPTIVRCIASLPLLLGTLSLFYSNTNVGADIAMIGFGLGLLFWDIGHGDGRPVKA